MTYVPHWPRQCYLDVDAIQHAEKLLFSLIVFKVLLTKWNFLTFESEQAKLDKNVHMMPQKQCLSWHIQKYFYNISCSLEHQIPKLRILNFQLDNQIVFDENPQIKPRFVEIVQIYENIDS